MSRIAKEPPVGVRFPAEVFPAEVKTALEKLARADDRSISYVVNKIVAEYLRAKKTHQMTAREAFGPLLEDHRNHLGPVLSHATPHNR